MLSDTEVFNGSCACHINPPCSWCTSLTLEEADIICSDGRESLEMYWRENNYQRKEE